MALVQMNFESRYLNNNHEISIILPACRVLRQRQKVQGALAFARHLR